MTEIARRATRLVPNRFQSLALVGAVLVSLCSVPNAKAEITFVIPPVRSGDYTLEGSVPAPVQIVVEDGRKEGAPFADAKIGISKLNLKLTESGTDPVTFLAESIASELTKHGIAASTKPSAGAAVIKLRLEQFYVDVRFATSFGPTTTLTRLRTVVTYNGESQLVSGAVVRSMVLKSTARKNKKGSWTYVFSDPVHMVIREAAAKLNRHYWSLSVPDSKTDQMIAAVPETLVPGTVTKLVDLSSTNNQRATKYFVGRVTHPDQTHRRAALWALGLLGSNAEVPLLEKTAMESDDGSLMMSLKSLGDIGTPEARAAMKKLEDAKRPTLSDRGIQWLDAVLSLYVEELDALRDLFRGVESQKPPVAVVAAPVGVVAAPVGVGAAPATVAAAQEGGCFPLCRSGHTCDPTSKSCVPTAEAPPPPATARDDACFPPCRVGFVCDQSRGECVQETTAAPP